MKNLSTLRQLNLVLLIALIPLLSTCNKKDPPPKPVAYFTYYPNTNLVAPVTLSFTNKSENANSYLWTYGTGLTDTNKDIVLTASSGGTYTVTLTVKGDGGTDTYSRTITVTNPTPPPSAQTTAGFTYSPSQNLVAPAKITFTNTSKNADNHKWNFGDGTTSTDVNPVKEFTKAGTYKVKLTATGKNNSNEFTADITINAAVTTVPIADFAYAPSSNLTAPVKVTFTNTSKNATSYKWDFGDGSTSTDVSPTKEFTKAGDFTVKLTATDAKNQTAQKSVTISVKAAVTPQRTTTSPDTYFIDLRKTFSKYGDWTAEGFTLTQTTTFTFYFASQYKAQAAIVTDAELNNFKTMNAFRGFGIFDNQYGYNSLTLPPGKYYVAVRNTTNGSNITSLELDHTITLPASDRCNYYDKYIEGAKSWGTGGKMWHGFAIQSGFRYFMDGCNTGFDTYIIPEDQLDNFKNGRQFTVYTNYNSTTNDGPGLYEVKLPPGTYYFVAANTTKESQAIVYLMQRWQLY